MKAIACGMCVIFVLMWSVLSLHAQLDPAAPWPMFRHDMRHTALSPFKGPSSGTLSWSYETGSGMDTSPAIGSDGRVFASAYDNVMYAFFSSGSLTWSYMTENNISSSAAIGSDGKIYVGSWDNGLYTLASPGFLVWSYVTGDNVPSSPALNDEGVVFVGSQDNRFYAFSSAGSLAWSYVTGNATDDSPSIGADDRIYTSSRDARIYNFSHTGSLTWSYETGYAIIRSSPAIGSDGRIYNGSNDNVLYALTSAGSLAWSYRTGESVESSPAVDSAERVYVGSEDNRFYALTSTGSLLWSFFIGDYVDASPAIGAAGKVYVGTEVNRLYVFEDRPTATPTATPTPNYINLTAGPLSVSPGSLVTLSWSVDFSTYDYEGVPVDVYLTAVQNPVVVDAPSGVADALAGGRVFLFGPGLNNVNLLDGAPIVPAFSNVAFPPVALSGTLDFAVPANPALSGDWVFATAFIRKDTGQFVRTDGLPVENSNLFAIE